MSYIDRVTEKRQATALTTKEQTELGAMLSELKKMQMATMVAGQGRSTVILTDQTDLGDKMKELTTKLVEAVKAADVTTLNKDQITQLKELHNDLSRIEKAQALSLATSNKTNKELIEAIRSLKLMSNVTVPQPKVTIQERAIDFSPLQATIREVMAPQDVNYQPDRTDLSRYRAVDIKDTDQDTQYVGFMNPEGAWYIIENKVRENSMRYLFGVNDYSKHFKKASSYVYQLLDKAIHAA